MFSVTVQTTGLVYSAHACTVYITLHLDDVDEDGGEAVEGGAAPHCLDVGAEGSKQGQSHLQRTCVAILRGGGRSEGERMAVLP